MNTLEIRRRIPEPIKRLFRWPYHLWSLRLDKEMINDLSEYLDMDRNDILWFLKSKGRPTNYFWHYLNPKTDEEVKGFYEKNPFYMFDLIYWHSTRYQKALRTRMINMAKGNILDYGGGVGFLSMEAAKKGLKVDFADVEGRMFEFAKWLFQKKDLNINIINLSREKISKKYDTIFFIDVLEHVKNPKEMLREVVGYLNDNGRLIIIVDHIASREIPLHFELGFHVEDYLKSLGMKATNDPILFIKKS